MTDDVRLPTHVWLDAGLRRCSAEGVPVMVVHRGEAESGTVMVRLNLLDGTCRVLFQARDPEGRPGWMAAFAGAAVAEAEAEAYTARAIDRDPDLWVVDIDDRTGRLPFDGPVWT